MELSEKELLKKVSSIKSPRKWVDFIISLEINQQKKGHLTKLWLRKHDIDRDELQNARMKSDLWKEKSRINARNRRMKIESRANTVNTGKNWTPSEIKKLKDNIDRPESELVKLLKRSLQSINARKRLIRMELQGISTENTGKPWSKKDLGILEKNFSLPAFELAKKLKRTVKSIQRQKDRIRIKSNQ